MVGVGILADRARTGFPFLCFLFLLKFEDLFQRVDHTCNRFEVDKYDRRDV